MLVDQLTVMFQYLYEVTGSAISGGGNCASALRKTENFEGTLFPKSAQAGFPSSIILTTLAMLMLYRKGGEIRPKRRHRGGRGCNIRDSAMLPHGCDEGTRLCCTLMINKISTPGYSSDCSGMTGVRDDPWFKRWRASSAFQADLSQGCEMAVLFYYLYQHGSPFEKAPW